MSSSKKVQFELIINAFDHGKPGVLKARSMKVFNQFDYVRLKETFDYRTFDCVGMAKHLGDFDYVRLPNPIKNNRTIGFDWVRLPNVRLTTPGVMSLSVHDSLSL